MIAMMLALALGGAQTPEPSPAPIEVPAACQPDATGQVDMQACADAAPEGSMPRGLALINLASRAYLRGDYPEALRLYDAAIPPGQAVSSDIIFHTFRADTYAHAGRDEAALADAAFAWRILNGEVSPSGNPADDLPVTDELRFEVLIRILPILQDGDAEVFARAKAMMLALPATDGIALTNRAGLLNRLGEHAAAVADSRRALALLPTEVGVLNNHCFVLAEAGLAAEGLPQCEAAVAAAPDVATVRHSHAVALAAVGRCDEGERELAEARRLDPSSAEYARPLACAAA